MKYSYECSKCKSKEIYKPRKDLPKDPHTKCSQCGHENHFKDGDLEELKGEKSQLKKQKSIPPQNTSTAFIDDPDELLMSVSTRELNKEDPDPRWASILISVRKENIGKSKKEGSIQSKFKSMSISEVAKILSEKQEDTSLKPGLEENS